MNQHEWVYGCYAYYLENYIEPGNPEDGVWEVAHWPVSKCLGGTKTVLLLKEHHAVQGVLQSEEWQTPCLFGWELAYLSGELLVLGRKWKTEQARKSGAKGGAATKAKRAAMSEEERREYVRRQAEHGRKGGAKGGAAARAKLGKAVRITWPDGRTEVIPSTAEAARVLGCDPKTLRCSLARPLGDLMAPGPGPVRWVPSGVRVQRVA